MNAVPAEERWLVDVVDYPERQTDPQVRIVIGDLFEIDLPDHYFDAVFASNLLEHFHSPEEVAAFLDRMRETLAPGGVLALMGPNFKYCARDYFDCADHLLALTHISVQELLFAAGYKVTEVVPRFLPFSFRSRLPAWPAFTPSTSACRCSGGSRASSSSSSRRLRSAVSGTDLPFSVGEPAGKIARLTESERRATGDWAEA